MKVTYFTLGLISFKHFFTNKFLTILSPKLNEAVFFVFFYFCSFFFLYGHLKIFILFFMISIFELCTLTRILYLSLTFLQGLLAKSSFYLLLVFYEANTLSKFHRNFLVFQPPLKTISLFN